MRAKINGKYYDTQTGTLICQCDRGYLYKKYHANEFFLFDRKQITPVTWNDAKTIIHKWGTQTFYSNFFDPMDNPKRTNIDIPIASYNKLRELAGIKQTTMKQMLVEIIDKAHRNRDRHIR